MREYDDERELMGYIWRNFPQIARPYECVPSAERVRDELPPEFREEYWRHALECQRLIRESDEINARAGRDGPHPDLPQMSPKLSAAYSLAEEKLEKQIFWDKFLPYKDRVSIHRCARCERILVNEKSRQCLWCGYDWH